MNINTDFNVTRLLTKSLYNPAINDPNVNNPCLKCGEPSLHLLHGARVNFLNDIIIIRYIFIKSPSHHLDGEDHLDVLQVPLVPLLLPRDVAELLGLLVNHGLGS